MSSRNSLRIAFVHPDLGIGGAERLIVDAAKTLQQRGHKVIIFTSHHSPQHCFEETKSGKLDEELQVEVAGDFLPRQLFGMFHLLFTALRSLYLSLYLFMFFPLHFDVIVVDQVSFSIPILRHCADRLIFYCHFPDKFLAPRSHNPLRKFVYRRWFDDLEAYTISQAHRVLVNSNFTAGKYLEAFPGAKSKPIVVRPGVGLADFKIPFYRQKDDGIKFPWSPSSLVITSLNRFERKKNIKLAIESFRWLCKKLEPKLFAELRLVIAGGYDLRVKENVDYLSELAGLCNKYGLEYSIIWPDDKLKASKRPQDSQVFFMPSISDATRDALLQRSLCLVYTPAEEHFGIVPVEAMALGIPVIAVNSGGPSETILNGTTGYLCEQSASSFGDHIRTLLTGRVDLATLSESAQKHARDKFSLKRFGDDFERNIFEVLEL